MDESREKGGRSEKSLACLTRKFVELLKNSQDVDLNVVGCFTKIVSYKMKFNKSVYFSRPLFAFCI